MKFRKTISLFSTIVLLFVNFNILIYADEQNLSQQKIFQEVEAKEERYRTLSSVSMILEREINGKIEVLLQLRQNTGWMDGFWDLGASGHVDKGETLIDAAIRETNEELEINVIPEDVEFLHLSHNNYGENRIYYCFYVKIKNYSGEIKIGEPKKCAELKWFGIENLPENIIPVQKSALENYQKGIIYNEIGWK